MTGQLEQLADLVRERSGIVLHAQRLDALTMALGKLTPPLDAGAALRAARDPSTGKAFVAGLLEAVAVHETFFFRQREDLDAIDWPGLLASARARGAPALRTWVAGCSTGEEAYTLAILASEALGTSPPLALLATDLSAAAVRRAEHGEYASRAVRHVTPHQRERYFRSDGSLLVVGPELRALVTFAQHNLVADPVPQAQFDLILCRNVLIYFDPPTVEQVLRTLERALAPGGMLLLGAADRLCRPRLRSRNQPATRVRARRAGPQRPADTGAVEHWRTRRTPAPSGASARDEAEIEAVLAGALAAADGGRLDEALAVIHELLATDPLDADAYFVQGIALLGRGETAAAIESLRRALYVDPSFALASFQLARAYDTLGDGTAARRAYLQALRSLTPGYDRHERLVVEVDLADVAAACGTRIAALGRSSPA